ncbi:hypothetical protein FQN50_007429 [Emmonsiellopsis sp. PD_5]|nr:hypothetical protein FQN50_007429 [Emmonsiellopsis sp. PD_5]
MRSLKELRGIPFLSIITLLVGFLLQSSFFQHGALASPIEDLHARELAKRYTGTPSGKIGNGGPDTSDYPSDDDIRSAYIDTSVFFAQIGDSDPAYRFAKDEVGGNIFRGNFPSKWTNRNGRSKEWYQDFADRFSGVFAEKASREVFFVAPWDEEIEDCRVWKRIEFPTLVMNPSVSQITLVNYKDFGQRKAIWARPFIVPPEKRENQLQKRESACFDWYGYGEDPSTGGEDTLDYSPGWCGIHITQYQKNDRDNPNPDYRFDISIKDHQGQEIGRADFADGSKNIDIFSALPWVLIVTAGDEDSDPVSFAYSDQSWDSNDESRCSMGKYDSGNRDGDCGFSC